MSRLFRRYVEAQASRFKGFTVPSPGGAELVSLPEFYMGEELGRMFISSSEAHMLRRELEFLSSRIEKLRFRVRILGLTSLALSLLLLAKLLGLW